MRVNYRDEKLLLLWLFILAAFMAPIADFGRADNAATDKPQIGTINGQPMFGEKPQRSVEAFTVKHGKPPASDSDQQEIAAIAAQNRQQIGSADGQPIFQPKDRTTSPDTALQHRCDDIKGQITHIARETAKRQFAVTVTPDEVAQLATQYWAQHDAAAEVQKYKQQWPSAAAITVDGWKKGHEAQFQKILADRKLDDSVDAQLAAGDPQFRTYLNEYHQRGTWVTPVEYQSDMPQADAAYLKQKRSEFWQSRYAQQQVTLNDPALADQCQLGSTLGVKIAGAKGL